MTKTHRTKGNERLPARTADTTTLDGDRASRASFGRERQMVDLGIGYDGQHYTYNGYRYDRLADAVAYAQLMRSRPMQEDAGGRFSSVSALALPTDAQRSLMHSLAIDFRDGAYRFKGFRYDGLADAVNYARLTRQRQDEPGASATEGPGGTVMLLEHVDTLNARLARAHSERDAWRAAGLQEKYLEAWSMVEALELQLEEHVRQPNG